MIPLRDSTPSGTAPIVTVALIIVNALVWLYEASLGHAADQFISQYGLTPFRFTHAQQFAGGFVTNGLFPLVTSIFLHGGWMHVIGNMWFLWIFGDNVEDRLGHFKYLFFYLVCGVGAALSHVYFHPMSQVPMVGASGAISGVLGAYLISYPHARVHTLLIIVFIFKLVEIPAFVFLILWFALQFMSGAAELGGAYQDMGGVAYWAHMGGFVIGIMLIWLLPQNPRKTSVAWYDDRRWGPAGMRRPR